MNQDQIRKAMERRPITAKEFDELDARVLSLTITVLAMADVLGVEQATIVGERVKAICDHIEQKTKTDSTVSPWQVIDALSRGES